MLECDACGRRLVGDKDRYRHINACRSFRAVAPQPERPTRGQHLRIPGQSYPRIDFESLVPLVLERVSLGAADIAATVSLYHSMRGPGPDQLAITTGSLHGTGSARPLNVRPRPRYGRAG